MAMFLVDRSFVLNLYYNPRYLLSTKYNTLY